MSNETKIISGNEAAVLGAIDAGARIMYGYPITPATEILEGWVKEAQSDKSLRYLQTEDETSAGFALIGSIAAGEKAFTASAGPGHILLQDPISMAENLRLPFVGIIMQRGGPSTGTVNFSQQEVNLAAFGGNGDGLRVVYSASSIEEMYEYVIKAFNTAWKYRFPTFVLGDGYLGKMKTAVKLRKPIKNILSHEILKEEKTPTYLRNCYSSEESFAKVLTKNIYDWKINKEKIVESESYKTSDAREIIIAHGLVAAAAKEAVNMMRLENKKVGLFRPITINPIDTRKLRQLLPKIKVVHIFESSLSQFSRIVKYEAYGLDTPIIEHPKPAEEFTAQEIINQVERM